METTLPHVMATAVLDRGGAADRLRNHLRRRAITRVGLIEGDLYFLPYYRASGRGPEGEKVFHLLAAELGDPRLARANLLPADLKPFDAAAPPAGARVAQATLTPAEAAAAGDSIGWRADTLEELIHYPFWLMRVEDSGRIEGAWIDGVEGRIIHHSLKVPPPAPPARWIAAAFAGPSALLGALAWAVDRPALEAAGAAAIAAATGAALHVALVRRERRERDG